MPVRCHQHLRWNVNLCSCHVNREMELFELWDESKRGPNEDRFQTGAVQGIEIHHQLPIKLFPHISLLPNYD